MIGLYFSGTGNSRYILEQFCDEYEKDTKIYSIEDESAIEAIKNEELIVFSYSVQYSNLPKMLRDYVNNNGNLWNGKKVFIIATMGMFSGDGAGMLGRELKKHGATIVGGLHAKMPDSIGDVKLLKHPLEHNKETIAASVEKTRESARALKSGNPKKEGLGFFYHMAGLFGQRLYFRNMTKDYSNKLKIDNEACVGCGKCETLCPMKNIKVSDGKAEAFGKCTMCYRCVNNCPKQAITLLGKKVVMQSLIEKYL